MSELILECCGKPESQCRCSDEPEPKPNKDAEHQEILDGAIHSTHLLDEQIREHQLAIKDAECQARIEKIFKEIDIYIKQVVEADRFKDRDVLVDPVGLAALDYWWQALKKREGIR